MRREPPSMLHEVVNYKVKGTRPRGRPRTTWLKRHGYPTLEERTSIKDVTSVTVIHIPTWRLLIRRWLEEGGGGKDKPWNLQKEVARRRWWEGQTLESTEGGG